VNDEALIEAAAGAFRERTADGEIEVHPSWRDLDAAGRVAAYEAAARSRRIEAALDPDNLSTTAHAVLARIRA
jgi:hypothetical protein